MRVTEIDGPTREHTNFNILYVRAPLAIIMSKADYRVKIFQGQLNWLNEMQKDEAYGLPDLGKAFRCCVNFAAQTDGETKAVAGAADLLKAHCEKFSKEAGAGSSNDEVECVFELAKTQSTWLEETAANVCAGDLSEASRQLLAICMARENPEDVFGKVRCKTKTAPESREGFKEAVASGLPAAEQSQVSTG